MSRSETFVIVGANLAGGRAAESFRARGFDGRVVLIGEEPEGPYERPPLTKEVLKGTMAADETLLRPADKWRSDDIELLTGTRVTRIVPAEQAVQLSSGDRLVADKVLLCTGARVRRLGVPGANLDGVHYLRTIADAVAVRQRLEPGAPVVVIGAGFIGAEVAACAREAGCRVTVLEMAPVPLGRVLGEDLGAAYARYHRKRGVDLRTGIGVMRVEGQSGVRAVVASDGSRIEAACVVIGVGVEPAVELAREAGIDTADGIVVDEFCQTSMPNVYAAGDVANSPNPFLGRRVRFEHWRHAQNQAVAAAGSMLGERAAFAELPWFWSDQYDLNLQVAGDPGAADEVVLRGDADSERFCAFYLRAGTLAGVLAVNNPRELRAAMNLIRRGSPVDARELADADVDLRGLGRLPADRPGV